MPATILSTRFLPSSIPVQYTASCFIRYRNCASLSYKGDKVPSSPLKIPTTIGRNAPCPCGSGTKFKKCCRRKMEPKSRPAPPAVMEKARVMFQKKMEAERKRVERHGEVYPIRSTVNFGKRLVPVGNAIYATDI